HLLGINRRVQRERWIEQAKDLIGDTLVPADPAAPAGRGNSNIATFRSVRSEAYRPPGAGNQDPPDDLKRIRGVGALIERKLISMGHAKYSDVANWTASDVARVSQQLDFHGRIERENWIEQARILASGGQTEFSRRFDRGET
ncbi:MAG: hypothetical protein ACR2PA_17525, partial [Hyphomicrobiaceae bacterium]